jgi:hypothetical protein
MREGDATMRYQTLGELVIGIPQCHGREFIVE